ncbi:MAG: hypothetical protein RLZ47_353 [Bacteroidota bacterium]|jgi:hypothetical protein
MKKSFYLLILILVNFSAAFALKNEKFIGDRSAVSTYEKDRIQQIESRILEIKSMDKSKLSSQERKALRKEIQQMRKEMKGFTSGGVYLSVAAIIIIILVLILII